MFAESSMSLPTTTQYGATANNRGVTSANSATSAGTAANPYLSEYDPATMNQQLQQASASNQSNAVSGYLGTASSGSEGATVAAAPDLSASLPANPVSVPGAVSGSTDAYAAEVQASSDDTTSSSSNFGGYTTSGTGAPTPDGSLVPSQSAPQSSTMYQQQASPDAVAAQEAQSQAPAPADASDASTVASDDDDAASIPSSTASRSDDDDTVQADNVRSVADSNRSSDTRQFDTRDTPPPAEPPKQQAPKQDDSANQPPVAVQVPNNDPVVVSDASVSD